MPNFIATVEVTLHITADTREDAKKLVRKWKGATSVSSTSLGWLEWNYQHTLKSLKKSTINPFTKSEDEEQEDLELNW